MLKNYAFPNEVIGEVQASASWENIHYSEFECSSSLLLDWISGLGFITVFLIDFL